MAKVLGAIAALILAVGVLWGAGELHYRNCVDAAKASGAPNVETLQDKARRALAGESAGPTVRERIRGCSRLP